MGDTQGALYDRLPAFRRARGYRLYGHDGKRYLDLWQQGGRALLGHRPGRVTTVLKNVISTGLVADLPSVHARRLERALLGQFPGCRAFRVTASLGAALELASVYLGHPVGPGDIRDPLRDPEDPAPELALWRPACPQSLSPRVLLPRLPFTLAGAPVPVGFAEELPAGFPPSEVLSPVVLAGALRALHDLRRYRPPEWLGQALAAGTAGWERRGLYVLPRFQAGDYPSVFEGFLAEEVVLNPCFPEASILPSEASPGELQKMIGLFRRFPGE
ncbi:MAG: hypothetical protein JW820_03575 [Spirochaetales bacterium]|nr:hypothetical protein [Spirochaetales bacterium]